jgi:uncharacterized phage protein (TIGR02220 family)
MNGWIKLMRSAELLEVLEHYPNAFTLLTLIAVRARRSDEKLNPHNLGLGEALIGDYQAAGMSRQQYRTAIDKLKEMGLVTIKATNKGTVATICNSVIYDINLDHNQPTTQPTIQPAAQPSSEPTMQPAISQPEAAEATTNNKEELEAPKTIEEKIEEIVTYLNIRTGSKFRPSTKSTQGSIKARLAEGYKLEDFKRVIDTKAEKWLNDPKMSDYLRPETLFTPTHFESYLNEKGKGEALVMDVEALQKMKTDNPQAFSEMAVKIKEAGFRPYYVKGAENKSIWKGFVDIKNPSTVQKYENAGYEIKRDGEGKIERFIQK